MVIYYIIAYPYSQVGASPNFCGARNFCIVLMADPLWSSLPGCGGFKPSVFLEKAILKAGGFMPKMGGG
ncbi:hypothetical protein TQ38_017390 [Novosphingobium sp. P6W]|nr:hypothetical protein TQ38_017390 [Novosphingobium sp. P6W]KIS32364.1 hypothetical protein TQ38_12090 [Novosphingobium sp. P6W]